MQSEELRGLSGASKAGASPKAERPSGRCTVAVPPLTVSLVTREPSPLRSQGYLQLDQATTLYGRARSSAPRAKSLIGVIFEVRDCRGPSMLSTAPCPRLQDAAHAVGCLRDIMKCVTSHREMRLRLRFIGYSRLAQLIKRHPLLASSSIPTTAATCSCPVRRRKLGSRPYDFEPST